MNWQFIYKNNLKKTAIFVSKGTSLSTKDTMGIGKRRLIIVIIEFNGEQSKKMREIGLNRFKFSFKHIVTRKDIPQAGNRQFFIVIKRL